MNRYLVVALFACTPSAPKQAAPIASHVDKGIEVVDLDRTADPCTDFYQFATGGWRAANPIPASQPRWSRRAAARETNRRQLQEILGELSRRADVPPGSTDQLVGDYYASCMNEASIDAAGVTPLAPLLAEIDGARTPGDVQRVIRRLHALAVPVPFGIAGAMDVHAPTNFIANLVAGGLGLPDRDYYVKPDHADARQKYRAHVAAVLGLAGASDPTHDADAIIALETRLAGASLASAAAADPVATDHKMSFAQLQKLAPHFEWATYFDEAHLPRVDLNVAEPAYMQQVDKELGDTPIASWKAYLEWQLLRSASPWLSKPFVDESFAFDDNYLAHATEMKPRARRCVDSTEALLAEPLAKKYADKYFSPAAKAKLRAIARTLLTVLQAEIPGETWMQPETKTKALAKLATTSIEIGYPDHWNDFSTLAIHRDALWANVAVARARSVADDRSKIGKPTPRDLWQLPSSSPDAYIEPMLNQLVLPAGYLQPPVFDVDATDAFNYGAIGIGLAHDLTHGIDTLGSGFDPMGTPVPWWTDADRDAFAKRGQCVIDQFDGYAIDASTHLQGKRVMSEVIGDLAGVRLAYKAFEATHPVTVVDGFTPEQQFFIAWGQFRGEDMRLEAQRQMIGSDIHPVPKFRVNGTLSDAPEFQRAFSCKAGAAMVRELRCAVW